MILSEIKCNAGSPYTIKIEDGLLEDIGLHISALVIKLKIMVVVDSTVDALYSQILIKSLKSSGFEVYKYVFKAGEKSKSFKTYSEIIQQLSKNDFSKTDIVLGFGGGVACDLAGFVASTYLRGLKLIMVPTTLLCDVDASIGGKNAVNFNNIKNQIGNIYQPLAVFIDPQVLKSLKKKVLYDGFAEVVKYSIISNRPMGDSTLFDILEKGDFSKNISQIISTCASIKANIVEADEFDNGKRQLLNLGHTFGHALECASAYKISHGVAVANGIKMVMNIAVKNYSFSPDLQERILKTLKRFNLLIDIPYTSKELEGTILHDKKIRNSNINLIIPYNLGDVRIEKIKIADLSSILNIALK